MGAHNDNLGLEVLLFQHDAKEDVLRKNQRNVIRPYSIYINVPGPKFKTSSHPVVPDYFDAIMPTEALELAKSHAGKVQQN